MNIPLILLTLALRTQQTGQSQEVSLVSLARPCEEVLAGLSKQTGKTFKVASDLRYEPLILDVKNIPVDVLLSGIARVTNGEWVDDGNDGKRLVLTADRKKQLESEELEARLAVVNERLEPVREWRKKLPTFDNDEAKTVSEKLRRGRGQSILDMSGRTPYGRLAYRLLEAIDPKEIAQLVPLERKVFSTAPNKTQYRFQGQISKSIADFNEACGSYVDAWKANPSRGPLYENLLELQQSGIGKVTAAIGRTAFADEFSLEVTVWTKQNKRHRQWKQNEWGGSVIDRTGVPSKEKLPKILPASEYTRNLLDEIRTSLSIGITRQSKETDPFLLEPERFDPLSFVATDGLKGLAKDRNEQLIALVEDSAAAITFNFTGPEAKVNPDTFWKWLTRDNIVERQAGCMLVRPRFPVQARMQRTRRDHLGFFLRAIKNSNGDLQALGRNLTYIPDSYLQSMNRIYTSVIEDFSLVASPVNSNTLRLLATLPPNQANSLLDGRPLQFFNLQAPSRNLLLAMATFDKSEVGIITIQPFSSLVLPPIDPTELLPNGLPGDGWIQGDITKEASAKPIIEVNGMSGRLRGMSSASLAKFLSFTKNSPNAPVIKGYQLGQNLKVDLAINYTEGLRLQPSLEQSSFSNRVYSYAELPAEFRKQIEETRKSDHVN